MKTCPNCKTSKPEGDFGLDRSSKNGLDARCRACNRARASIVRERNRANERTDPANVVKTCVKCKVAKPGSEFTVCRGTRDGLGFRCKTCLRDDYANCDKSRLKAARAAWYAKKKGSLKPRRADWYAKNKARALAKAAEWRKNNPQKIKVLMNRRRARVAAALATLTAEQWTAILELYGNACVYCGRPGKMTMDHVVPVSRGGGTTADNVVPACQSCNSSKNARTVEEWRKLSSAN